MQLVAVQAQVDFLERLARRGRPATALAELVWNALDADAKSVRVDIKESLGGIQSITITDDGDGITPAEAATAFGNLGGSWKRTREFTRGERRLLHGKEGKGRFRAFALGADVTWTSTAADGDGNVRIRIAGNADDLRHFRLSAPEPTEEQRGTVVNILNVWENLPDSALQSIREELTEILAPYLAQYPQVKVLLNEEPVELALSEEAITRYKLGTVDVQDGLVEDAELHIIEWPRSTTRCLYLCDPDGFSIARVKPGTAPKSHHFTAYLRSAYLRQHADLLALDAMHPGVDGLIARARELIREHFRARAAEQARETVEQWKSSDIYPFEGEPTSAVEVAERQVFDVVAYNVASFLPSFAVAAKENQQLSFRLLRQAIEENPTSLRRILSDVLKLPKEQQDELARLLDRTSLSSVITAAREVADRLEFIRGLELLLFTPATKRDLQERTQLHRILASQTWLFGESMRLTVDDQSLNDVLRHHLSTLRRVNEDTQRDNLPIDDIPPVLREDGSEGVVDLMLSRAVRHNDPSLREHLVIELKRPSQSINPAVISQVRSYAFAIARDERFAGVKARWVFWALSNRVTEQARWELSDPERGLLMDKDGMAIYVKTWAEVINENRARLQFFQDRLQYLPTDEDAVGYLQQVHSKYVPSSVATLAKA